MRRRRSSVGVTSRDLDVQFNDLKEQDAFVALSTARKCIRPPLCEY
jgi:hypothetical protein